ncbi:hypothetical protein BaRGS_00027084 [Batillaria attramentaria]|uniref:Uncharacterized protein n=1 Tax=Batillaria attramentaria TaxID=370345 RepID=A0ABD0K4C9_9CAEN
METTIELKRVDRQAELPELAPRALFLSRRKPAERFSGLRGGDAWIRTPCVCRLVGLQAVVGLSQSRKVNNLIAGNTITSRCFSISIDTKPRNPRILLLAVRTILVTLDFPTPPLACPQPP